MDIRRSTGLWTAAWWLSYSLTTFTSSIPASVRLAPQYIFTTMVSLGKDEFAVGTAFCLPGSTSMVVSAAHTLGPTLVLVDQDKAVHTVKTYAKDDERDIGVAFLEVDDKACQGNPFEWARTSGEVGDVIWGVGIPGGWGAPATTNGIISSPTGKYMSFNHIRVAELHRMGGDSGSPVFDAQGRIIGVLVGATKNGVLNAIVPVEEIRKALK